MRLSCSNEEFSSIHESIDGIRFSATVEKIVKVPRQPLQKILEDREEILSKFGNDNSVERYLKKRAALNKGVTPDMIYELKEATKQSRKGADYFKVPHLAIVRLLEEYSSLCGILKLE